MACNHCDSMQLNVQVSAECGFHGCNACFERHALEGACCYINDTEAVCFYHCKHCGHDTTQGAAGERTAECDECYEDRHRYHCEDCDDRGTLLPADITLSRKAIPCPRCKTRQWILNIG